MEESYRRTYAGAGVGAVIGGILAGPAGAAAGGAIGGGLGYKADEEKNTEIRKKKASENEDYRLKKPKR